MVKFHAKLRFECFSQIFCFPCHGNRMVFFFKECNIETDSTNQSADVLYVSENDLQEISKILHEKTLKAILKATLY